MTRFQILTDASAQTGLGHLSRMLALRAALRENGELPSLLVFTDPNTEAYVLRQHGESQDWLANAHSLAPADIRIIDSYRPDASALETLAAGAKHLYYWDDENRLPYPVGTVVNGAVGAEHLDYPDRSGVDYLLGGEYMLLRPEFGAPPSKVISESIGSVLLTFGGDDPRNLLPPLLAALSEHHPELQLSVVVGPGYTKQSLLAPHLDTRTQLIQGADAEAMLQLMLSADLAISAGGQTLQELVAVGVPTLAVGIVSNQLHIAKGLSEAGGCLYAGWWQSPELVPSILRGINSLTSPTDRARLSTTARSLIDGKGGERLARQMISTLPSLSR